MSERTHTVTAQRIASVVARLERDLVATAHPDEREIVEAIVEHALTFVDGDEWFERKVVEDVQQRLHGERIDTVWPACPRHGRHPLWLHDGAWVCEQDNVVIAPLGGLPHAAGGDSG
jgi:hypothetical protein